jgi:hypothetical protein
MAGVCLQLINGDITSSMSFESAGFSSSDTIRERIGLSAAFQSRISTLQENITPQGVKCGRVFNS